MKSITKKSFLKLAMILVAAFMFAVNGVNAQILTDYQDVNETVYQTVSKDFRLYVLPDPVYSPDHVAATNADLGPTAQWTWAWTVDAVAGPGKAAANENWVQMTDPAIGTYVFTVIESNTAFACEDAGTTKTVEVIAAPTATITTADISECGDQLAQAINIRIVENVPDALATYAFAVVETVDNVDINGTVTSAITSATPVDFTLAAKGAADGGAGWTAASPDFDYDFTSSALTVQNGLPTRYTYTLVKATDDPGAAADGIISAITQKSDYLTGGDYTTYAFTDNQVVFTVNPTPVTGPIYHIPNDFAL